MDFNKNIKLNFAGGNLTSNSGLLLYKEFDNKIKFSQIIKESLSFGFSSFSVGTKLF